MGRSSARKLSCYALVAALTCSILLFAKSKDKDKKDEDNGDKSKDVNAEVKFTSRTELVLIPTLVTDKSGNHITGLKQDDFTVLENGAAQKIATFEEVASAARRFPRSTNPNEFSNALGGEPTARRITVIVLDFINTPYLDQTNARKELLKYLTESVDQREPTALYTVTHSGMHVIHDFTADPRVLAAALHKVKGDAAQLVDTQEDVEAVTRGGQPRRQRRRRPRCRAN